MLGMMAKFWTLGEVKTRLGRSTGMHQAARIHQLFVQKLSKSLAHSADQRVAVVTPANQASRFAAQISPQWSIVCQSDGDLGQRMMNWFSHTLGQPDPVDPHSSGDDASPSPFAGQRMAVLIGADCPLIDPDVIESAASKLESHDVVLGPADDGGYYLIGLRGPWRSDYESLFVSMPWSSDAVMSETRTRCQNQRLALATLENREDIDTIESLDRLRTLLRSREDVDSSARDLLQQIDSVLCQKEPT